MLIGTKARHRPDPALHRQAVEMIRADGLEMAWQTFWQPLFSPSAPRHVMAAARAIALAQRPASIALGVDVFHARPSRDDFLAGCSVPVIVVTGADDVAPGQAVSAQQANEAPMGRLCVVPACGHYVPMEKPETINAILSDLIAELA
ncbi:alpha/beta fold hydrolase [Pararhizobium antarcticum]|uniref:AB hydrolase-1 domain-containing protein n=1 Tax=Pararhizobium antarcticum TaxID=1798805 RepID=A0A657LNB3_9HYPH|nr:hypothetical protein [Pararhizobium antarcticum]OJF92879.1 hypothetical protein AX760_21865 [Pararhizobium antarcticum]OJF97722.1 hypothetical protein AX761_14100 [Rhizobium sp. 58]